MGASVYNYGTGLGGIELLESGWQLPRLEKLQHVLICASPDVATAAFEAYAAAWWWADGAIYSKTDERFYEGEKLFEDADLALVVAGDSSGYGIR
jgi:hypothetical protein